MGIILSLIFIFGANKTEAFRKFIDKCHSCTADWCNKVLSATGKEILIKSVVQALPTYMMSYFRFLESVLKKYQSALLNYWWGAEGGLRKTHWIRKEILFAGKQAGGL